MKNAMRVLAGTIILLGFGFMSFSQNSVLSEGNWSKVSVEETGVYKITYNDLVSYGIDPSQVDPQNIRLYGNGNGMLPESNDEFRYDDLQENGIMVFGEEDGNFDAQDYILFYGEGPTEWRMDSESGLFVHETNLYTDQTYYFLNFDLGEGKRIEELPSSTLTENGFSDSFDDYYVHELEEINLIHSGKDWFGEEFSEVVSYDFEVVFPNLSSGNQLSFKSKAAARADAISVLDFSINNIATMQLNFPSINFQNYNGDYAKEKHETILFNSSDEILSVNISYQKPSDSSMAWLDYFELNARRHLIYDEGQMSFRDKLNSFSGDIIKFKVYTENQNVSIWNVTDPLNINSQEYEIETDGVLYKTEVEGLEEFIIFDESEYFSATFIGEVENQNLHAVQPVDLMIITHNDFLSQAEELSQLHQSSQGISVEVVELPKIYNEFSSGVQDVTAIRDFIKYIYEKQLQPSHMNVMLIGNASFDYQDRIENNTNYIPIWESLESLNPVSSYCTDDYFGIFEDNNYQFELGIGRLPVSTIIEADILVDKITHYITNQSTMGDWRNRMAFVADDEDGGLHLEQTDELTELTELWNPAANNEKVYLDAFEQEDTPEGQRYPDVNEAINNAVNNGASIIGYTGHGSYLGWAHEQVLTESDIGNWVNPNMYPLIMAATVEFGRIDDPVKNSLAKKIILLENAGAISIYTANRATYAGANRILQENFYKAILNNPQNSVGEAVKFSKQMSGFTQNSKKFSLLGDPALRLAIPLNNIVTEAINGAAVEDFNDTIHPGDQIIITGYITDINDEPLFSFSGNLKVKVYDIIRTKSTLGNDPGSPVKSFFVQNSIIYELETQVVNGQFVFEFNLPNNSYPEFGNIKLSYYANDELVDAAGHFSGIAVGGLAGTNPAYMMESNFITFYPTIVTDRINFKTESDITNLELGIYNLQGICVKQSSFIESRKGNQGSMDVSDLTNGMYIIKAVSAAGIKSSKILKQ